MYPGAPRCQLEKFDLAMASPSPRSPFGALRFPGAVDAARKAPLLLVATTGIAGIVFVDRGAGLVAAMAGLILLAASLLWRRRSAATTALVAGAAVSLLLFAWRHHQRLRSIRSFPLASALAAGKTVEIEGEGWVVAPPEAGGRSLSTTVQLERIRLGGRELPCDHRIPCWILRHPEAIGYGSALRFTGRIAPLEGPLVPGGFDARSFYFRRSGSLGKLEIRDGDSLEILPGRKGSGLVRSAGALRDRLEDALLLGVPPDGEPYARLVAAMALGARENSPEELEESFRISGTMHLFAVSGLNVAIVAGILTWCAAAIGVVKSRAVIAIVPMVLFYAVLTGLSPSAVRAALMASAFLAGYALREKPRLLNSLGFAAILLLAWDPQALFLPGFQLSFAVLLFIAVLAPRLADRLAGPFLADPFLPRSLVRPARRLADRLSRSAAALAAVSIASWLGSAALLAWHFESVSPVGLLANLFMVPLASVVMGIAAVALAAYGLHLTWITLLANRLNVAASLLLTAMAEGFASIPGATVHTGRDAELERGVLRLDVVGERGEGAALLELPFPRASPRFWMIDTGGDRTYLARVLPLMRHRGLNRIEALVLTHGDEGHLGAASSALNQFRPSLLVESSVENRSPSHAGILEMAGRLGVERVTVDRGERLVAGETVIHVLHPSSLRPGRLADDRALVLKIVHGRHRILLTSDSGFETERFLLESGADVRADVWVKGQHSDSPSGLAAFVEAVEPRAIVSSHSEFPESERIGEAFRRLLREKSIALFEVEASGTVTIEVVTGGIRLSPFAEPGETLLIPAR